jgi:hypothetical protein
MAIGNIMTIHNKHLLIVKEEADKDGPAISLNVINGKLNLVLIYAANRMEIVYIERDIAIEIKEKLQQYLGED